MRLLTTADVDDTPESMKGKKLGVSTGAIRANLVESQLPEAKVKGFASPDEALAALKDGRIDIHSRLCPLEHGHIPDSKKVSECPYVYSCRLCRHPRQRWVAAGRCRWR